MRSEYEYENEEISAGKIICALLALLGFVFAVGASIGLFIEIAVSNKIIPSLIYVVLASIFICVLSMFGITKKAEDLIAAVLFLVFFVIFSYLCISIEPKQISDTELQQSVQIEVTSESNLQAVDISDLDAQIAELEAQKESIAAEQEKLDRIAELEAEIAELKKEK